MLKGIRTVEAETGNDGEYSRVRIVFGPHYFFELHREGEGSVMAVLGATHHGFKADASTFVGELESIINDIREEHPGNAVD